MTRAHQFSGQAKERLASFFREILPGESKGLSDPKEVGVIVARCNLDDWTSKRDYGGLDTTITGESELQDDFARHQLQKHPGEGEMSIKVEWSSVKS